MVFFVRKTFYFQDLKKNYINELVNWEKTISSREKLKRRSTVEKWIIVKRKAVLMSEI